jgi:hypothetical protein
VPALAKEEFGNKWVHVWDGSTPWPNYRALLSDTGATGGTSTTIEEKTREIIGETLVAGEGIDIVIDDPGNTITISAEIPEAYEDPHILLANQAAYDALTPVAGKIYMIPEA